MTEERGLEKTNPSGFEMSAAQWAARRLAHQECAESGNRFDLDRFDKVLKAERSRILGDRQETAATVLRYRAFLEQDAERRRQTPESEAEFYRQVPPVPYAWIPGPEGEPEPTRIMQPHFNALDRETRRAVSLFVADSMGYKENQAPIRRMQEYRSKCETVAGDPEFLEQAKQFAQDRSRDR